MIVELGVEIDVCDACSSLWLDKGELNQIVTQAPASSRLNLDAFNVEVSVRDDEELTCPRCDTSSFVDLTVDSVYASRCENCGGLHVDHECLDRLRGVNEYSESTSPDSGENDREPPAVAEVAGQSVFEGPFGLVLELVFHLITAV